VKQLPLIACVLLLIGCGSSRPAHTIPYITIKEEAMQFPPGWYRKIIVIDPQYSNETSMKYLGQTLAYEYKDKENFQIWIYDDEKAANMMGAAVGETLNEKDSAYHDLHQRGWYYYPHDYKIALEGSRGTIEQIDN
jgi:hypothetical protein